MFCRFVQYIHSPSSTTLQRGIKLSYHCGRVGHSSIVLTRYWKHVKICFVMCCTSYTVYSSAAPTVMYQSFPIVSTTIAISLTRNFFGIGQSHFVDGRIIFLIFSTPPVPRVRYILRRNAITFWNTHACVNVNIIGHRVSKII